MNHGQIWGNHSMLEIIYGIQKNVVDEIAKGTGQSIYT